MLRSRWLSTFTVIGVVLIALGIVGLVLGPRFVYDPGQPVTGKEAWCYLVIGILMVVNGFVTPAPTEEKQSPRVTGKNGQKPTVTAADKPKVREVTAASAANKSGE